MFPFLSWELFCRLSHGFRCILTEIQGQSVYMRQLLRSSLKRVALEYSGQIIRPREGREKMKSLHWRACKCLTSEKSLIVGFADFCGGNNPSITDFKQPTWRSLSMELGRNAKDQLSWAGRSCSSVPSAGRQDGCNRASQRSRRNWNSETRWGC